MQPLQPVSGSDLQRFLSAPEQLLQESVALQLAVASFHQTPRSLLEILVNSADAQVAEAARLHVNLAGEITDGWQQAVDEILQQRQLGQNDRLAVELLKLGTVPPCFFSEWVPAEPLIQGLRNPQMPLRYRLQLLQRLAQEPTLEPRLQVAESPETPLAVLEQLAGDLELPVRLAVKFNPSCPPPLIELVEGQYAVASDWNTDSEQLAMLGQSRWAWVRLAVAQNPSAPAETLMQLAGDAVYKIQLAVAKNPETPADVLAVLAEHQDKAIQAAVAEHGNATEEILHQVFPTQQQLLKRRENLPASILERFLNEAATDRPIWQNSELRYLFLDQPNTPTWILAELANVDLKLLRAKKRASNEPEILELNEPDIQEPFEKSIWNEISFLADVAKHPQVSVETLEQLARCPNPNVQIAVTHNSLTPIEVKLSLLEDLAVYPDKKIQVQIAAHPDTPVHILEAMGRNEFYHTKLLREIRRVLASEYAVDAWSYKSTADRFMSFLKHEILYSVGISVDIDRWIEMIECLDMVENAKDWRGITEDLEYVEELGDSPFERNSYVAQLIPFWAEVLPKLPEKLLQKVVANLLEILALIESDVKNYLRSVGTKLIGNSNTPVTLREELKNKLIRPSVPLDHPFNDCDLLLALIYNPATSEDERREYFEHANIRYSMAGDPRTPQNILEELFERGEKEALARNPATPKYLLRRIADEPQPHDSIWRVIAENPNAPADLLLRFVHHPHERQTDSNVTMFDLVIANPNLPVLERYRLLLSKEETQEIANANQLMARRTNSSYALAQLVQKGDQKAKLTAARSNQTPIQILEQLAKDPDESVRQYVMGNSNLPLSILIELTQDASDKIRLSLAYMLRNRSTNRYYKEEVPVVLLERLARDENKDVKVAVAENLQSSQTLLEQLAQDASAEVRIKVAKNPNTPASVLEQLAQDANVDVTFAVARNLYDAFAENPHTPASLLAKIARKRPRERDNYVSKVAKHRNTPASVLEQLAKADDANTRCNVAENPNTPISVLEELITDEYSRVLWAIAQRADTPTELLERLLLRFTDPNNQDYQQISYAISYRRELPPNLLELLMQSNLQEVYQGIATQANLPQAIVERLMAMSNESVLINLARNQSLAAEFLTQLAQNPNPNVCSAIVNHPNITPEIWLQLANHTDVSVRQVIAAYSNTPVNILEILARDLDNDVRAKVAKNPNLPVNILEQLARDEDAFVRTATASNSHLPATVLTQLANDQKVEVRRAVAQNPNTPAPIRETLRDLVVQPTTRQTSPTLRGLNRLYNPSTDDLVSILAEYASSENAFVRFVTLLHPLTPHEVLTQAAQSASWLERYAVADNSGTPSVLRQQLAQDSNRIVRAAARVNTNS